MRSKPMMVVLAPVALWAVCESVQDSWDPQRRVVLRLFGQNLESVREPVLHDFLGLLSPPEIDAAASHVPSSCDDGITDSSSAMEVPDPTDQGPVCLVNPNPNPPETLHDNDADKVHYHGGMVTGVPALDPLHDIRFIEDQHVMVTADALQTSCDHAGSADEHRAMNYDTHPVQEPVLPNSSGVQDPKECFSVNEWDAASDCRIRHSAGAPADTEIAARNLSVRLAGLKTSQQLSVFCQTIDIDTFFLSMPVRKRQLVNLSIDIGRVAYDFKEIRYMYKRRDTRKMLVLASMLMKKRASIPAGVVINGYIAKVFCDARAIMCCLDDHHQGQIDLFVAKWGLEINAPEFRPQCCSPNSPCTLPSDWMPLTEIMVGPDGLHACPRLKTLLKYTGTTKFQILETLREKTKHLTSSQLEKGLYNVLLDIEPILLCLRIHYHNDRDAFLAVYGAAFPTRDFRDRICPGPHQTGCGGRYHRFRTSAASSSSHAKTTRSTSERDALFTHPAIEVEIDGSDQPDSPLLGNLGFDDATTLTPAHAASISTLDEMKRFCEKVDVDDYFRSLCIRVVYVQIGPKKKHMRGRNQPFKIGTQNVRLPELFYMYAVENPRDFVIFFMFAYLKLVQFDKRELPLCLKIAMTRLLEPMMITFEERCLGNLDRFLEISHKYYKKTVFTTD